jgi:hypothetical protein
MPATTSQEHGGYVVLSDTVVRRVRLEVAAVRVIIDEIERSVSGAGPRIESSLEVQLLEPLSALARVLGGCSGSEAETEGTSRADLRSGWDSDRVRIALSHGPHEERSKTWHAHSDSRPSNGYSSFTSATSHLK